MATAAHTPITGPIRDMLLPPVTIMSLSEFNARPPSQFFYRDVNGLVVRNPQQLNFSLTDSHVNVMNVSNEVELEQLCSKLLNYPLVFNVGFKKKSTTVIPLPYITYVRSRSVRGNYVVTVWPQHPTIQPQLLEALNVARQEMASGNKFAIDLSFRNMLKDWFENIVADKANGCITYHNGEGLRICITNASPFSNFCRCDCPENCCEWTLGGLCWMIGGPIYLINRHCISKVTDQEFEIEGSVKTLLRIEVTTQRGRENILVIKTDDGRLIEDIRYKNRPQGTVTVNQPQATQPSIVTNRVIASTNGTANKASSPPTIATSPSINGAYDADRYRQTMEECAPKTTSDRANLIV